jgi:hypothetical protein
MVLSEDPEGADTSFEQDPLGEANLFGMKKGEKFEPLMIQDLKRTVIYILNLIETRLQRGTLPSSDYGNVSAPMSAVAIKQLGEARNKVLGPLMQTIGRARERLNRMIIDQWNMSEFSHSSIPDPGEGIMKSNFNIRVELVYLSPLENIANYSIASEARNYMKMEDVLAKILHDKTPQDTLRGKRAEEIEELVPELKVLRGYKDLLEDKKDDEAMLVGVRLAQMLSNQQAPDGGIAGKASQTAFNDAEASKARLMEMFGGGHKVAPGAPSSQQEAANMAEQLSVGGR